MNVQKEIQKLKLKPWIERPFNPFIISLFNEGSTKECAKKIGMPKVELLAQLYQNGFWYYGSAIGDSMRKQLEPLLKNQAIFDIADRLEKFHNKSKKRILFLVNQNNDVIKQLKELKEILAICTTYVWLTHGIEEVYNVRLANEVPQYIKQNVDEFIGSASFPKKKLAHALFEEAMLRREDPKKIVEEFGWIRIRDGFSRGFSINEVKKLTKNVKKQKPHKHIKVPKQLKELFDELQELVYFRTKRTDIFYELVFLARPILKKVAKYYDISFKDLKNYLIGDLISGKLKKYPTNFTFAKYKESYYIGKCKIIKDKEIYSKSAAYGMIAYKGIAKGYVKIVRVVSEIDKVKENDILVTQMTFPSYISAMNKAKAFVTDEGGLTCHAAIVAREMKKPCVIATKVATKIFKDGDYILVDANKGIVKIIEKSTKK